MKPHEVTVEIGGEILSSFTEYTITNDMLSPADDFSLVVAPLTRPIYDLVRPDREVDVAIDGTVVLKGLIDERQVRSASDAGSMLSFSGRDFGGRLVDESMDLMEVRDLDLRSVVLLSTGIWFADVTFSNAERGFTDASRAPRKVAPGETRWQFLSHFLEPARLLAWASADGTALVIGRPNYAQESQYSFFHAAQGSPRAPSSNVLALEMVDSVAERYSSLTVVGASRGNHWLKNRAEVQNGPSQGGTGKDFSFPKQLLVADDDVKNPRDAAKRAGWEMALRDATGQVIRLTALGHGQEGVLFAFDTMADFEDEVTGVRGRYLVVAVELMGSRLGGQTSTLTLVPEGTELSLS